ncbi:hypothetical protein LTR62_002993 [Meristemomyces frigidus]|uniref:gamma-glutamylcyclotransferase n=1 Tax=Meristemomyces frigidus TaxID=1508187 RepID=A0AAN7TS47_9PEZI|nr:hypothetical protein LTR62_002993 [Meristemomyces frigidus]
MSYQPTLYFGYGSNLWREQMEQRCPTSQYQGIARLQGYAWIINERGYANIVELAGKLSHGEDDGTVGNEVWGLVYSLEAKDERNLDRSEGVPYAYTKECLTVDYWHFDHDGKGRRVEESRKLEMLVYIDRVRVSVARPRDEYVVRMNKGIEDALVMGVPKEYVEEVLRKFIAEAEKGTGSYEC